MIDVQSLSMRYGNFRALEDVSFQARKGEILGLLGPNGAGKTTLMRLLTTYLYPFSGTAKIAGADLIQNPLEVRRQIGYLPETAPLYPDMRVDHYLKFAGDARGLDGKHLQERLDWVQNACQLKLYWKNRISELSKGMKQRVGLAQALLHDPQILILDEPTSGLDPIQILEIRNLIQSLAREKTIVFSTHILQEVEVLAGRIVLINQGRMVAQGTIAELGQGLPNPHPEKPLSLEEIFIQRLKPKTGVAL
ncbi:MAG TPA: multidrug ABC transporter ATP-binding protein [Candidatus Omnitrophica bacterium]|nr:multidrug ABC transporter ATP-binding protein [Candidatus Omnitrophota bacterium]